MVPKFNHFVITRFNLKQSIWPTDKQGLQINTTAWLEHRFSLFETYCFPSMQQQTVKTFTWLVYFDVETPDDFKKRITVLHSKFSNFKPIYVSSFRAFEDELPKHIQTYTMGNSPYVLTTRLDNDDCFHRDAIKVIQRHFKPIDLSIIDLKHGLSLQIHNGFKLSLKKNSSSGPFITLIEQLKPHHHLLTVYHREHLHWIGDAHFIDVTEGYYWLQIIHRHNITNQMGAELTCKKSYLKGYPISKTVKFSFRYCTFIVLKQMGLIRIIKKLMIN